MPGKKPLLKHALHFIWLAWYFLSKLFGFLFENIKIIEMISKEIVNDCLWGGGQ